jgi:hypothetical protein
MNPIIHLSRSRVLCLALLTACVTSVGGLAQTPPAQPGQTLDPLAMQWPRSFAANGYEFAVYQPQIAKWPGNQIQGRFATAVRPAGSSNETYGVAYFTARTEIDKMSRLVTLEDFKISKVDFPAQRAQQKVYQPIIQAELPQVAKTIPLDHLEAVFAVSGDVAKAKIQQVDNNPPRIIFTTQPSLLVLIDGAPIQKPLVGTYERVVNTRSIMLMNTNILEYGYYLYAASNWYSAPSIEGPWTVNLTPPADLSLALAAAFATKQVDPAYPTEPLAAPLKVYVSTVPAELLQTTGQANMLSYGNTDLLYVSNSDNAIFYDLDDSNYYVLISGRWFKALSLYGPWSFVAPGTLPADFKKIPPGGPKANVLVSIPGTPMAQEAVIANSIPQTATINRQEAKLTVEYVGGPSFVTIPGTSLQYAVNTETPVIMLSAKSYYACQNGAWFVAPSALGPWTVATTVPAVIYTIPTTCPIHYVTYAYVYGFTPLVVYVGYTPGYMGTVVVPGGVVVYGTGYYYPPVVVGTTYVSYPPTYGYGASMALGAAVGFAVGFAAGSSSSCWYEPHYGCYSYSYHYSSYSYMHCNVNSCSCYTHYGTAVSSTYAHGYNPYTGTSYSAHSASAYNPYSGNYASASHASAYNPYTGARATGSKGVEGNAYTGNYAAGKQGAAYNPSTGMYGAGQKTTVGNAYTGNSAADSRGMVGNANTGNKVAWNNGNVYTDKDGNVNKYNPSTSSYDKYGSSGWQSSTKSASYSSQMDHERQAQSTGSDRFSSWHGCGGGGWSRGGGGFHGGGFRR